MLLDLLRSKGPEVLDQLTIPKIAKIFIILLKLDHIDTNAQGMPVQEWPTAMTDLVQLPTCSEDLEHQKIHIRFIVKTMHIFEEEIVDK